MKKRRIEDGDFVGFLEPYDTTHITAPDGRYYASMRLCYTLTGALNEYAVMYVSPFDLPAFGGPGRLLFLN